jgi:hypothetical protein
MRLALALCLLAGPGFADPPEIERVSARVSSTGWTFDVTLSHPDTGWDHYADGWRVLDPDGKELGMRLLHHPHETEQPFTRSLSGLQIPEDVTQVQVEARCNVNGWSGQTVAVDLN